MTENTMRLMALAKQLRMLRSNVKLPSQSNTYHSTLDDIIPVVEMAAQASRDMDYEKSMSRADVLPFRLPEDSDD